MARHKRKPKRILLDAKAHGPIANNFLEFAAQHIVGQTRILECIAGALEEKSVGFRDKERPAASFLILGPSGVGKTETVKVVAEFLFRDPRGLFRLNGQDYSQRHEVARLLGAPPGYVGHDNEPLLTQEKLDKPAYQLLIEQFKENLPDEKKTQYHILERRYTELARKMLRLVSREDEGQETKRKNPEIGRIQTELEQIGEHIRKMGFPVYDSESNKYNSVLLIDEIERAHRKFHDFLYPILDEAIFELAPTKSGEYADGGTVAFENSFIFATSNLGSQEITKLLRVRSGEDLQMGFLKRSGVSFKEVDERVYKYSRNAAEKFFETPFLGRFDYFLVARPLYRGEIEKILDMQITCLQNNLILKWNLPIILRIDDGAKQFIVDDATDHPEKGARLLKRKLRHHVTKGLAILRSTSQIQEGDVIEVCLKSRKGAKKIVFYKKVNGRGKGTALIVPSS